MVQTTKKKLKKNVASGLIYIKSTFNNTIVTVTDLSGNSLAWASSGSAGFKNTRKGTSFAAQLASEKATLKAMEMGLKKVQVLVKGQGPGRETAIRVLPRTGIIILSIKDITSIPYNGCRPPKRRRV
jgi:small subunit ribosomal protein S11